MAKRKGHDRFRALAAAACVAALMAVALNSLTNPAYVPAKWRGEGDEDGWENESAPPPLEYIRGAIKFGEPQTKPYVAPMAPAPGSWSTKTAMPINRCDTPNGAIGVELLDSIYEFGGENYNTSYKMNLKYSTTTDQWTVRAPMPSPREEFAMSVVDGNFYVIAGHTWTLGYDMYFNPNSVDSLTTNEMYDPAANTWTTKAPIPEARTWGAAASVNGKIYVSGGWLLNPLGTPSHIQSTYEYDPAGNTWAKKADMPTKRTGHAAAVIDGRIFFIGGAQWNATANDLQVTGACDMYDPFTNTWTPKAPMPTPRGWYALAVIANKIYCIGGMLSSGASSSVNEVYDPATNTWYSETPMPTARQEVGASGVNGKIYVIGGWSEISPGMQQCLAMNEVFSPAELSAKMGVNPKSVICGNKSTASVIVTDNGNPVTGASVTFDDQAAGGSFGATTDHGNGTYSAQYTAPTVATSTYMQLNALVSKTGYADVAAHTYITVSPQYPMQVTLTVDPKTIVCTNTSNISVRAIDGNTAENIAGASVSLQCSGGGSFSPVADLGNGNYTSVYTPPPVPSQRYWTIWANVSKAGLIGAGASDHILVNPAPVPPLPPRLFVNVTASPATVKTGSKANITVEVECGGAPASGALIALSDSPSGGSFTSPVEAANGTYYAEYTSPAVASTTAVAIKANATKAGCLGGEKSAILTVTILPVLAVTVTASPATVTPGGSCAATATVLGEGGAPQASAGVTFSDGGAGGSFGAVLGNGDGTYSSQYTAPAASSPATITLIATASAAGYADGQGSAEIEVAPSQMSVTVTPSRPSVSSGDSMAVTVSIADALSAPVAGASVSLSDSGAGGTFSSVVDNEDGTYIASYTSPAVSSLATVTLTANASRQYFADAQGSAEITVNPEKMKYLGGSVAVESETAMPGAAVQVTVSVMDGSLPVDGAAVSISCAPSGSLSPSSGSTGPQGTMQATFTAPQVAQDTKITITATFTKAGYNGGTATANITVTSLLPDISVTSDGISFQGGGEGAVRVTVVNLGGAQASNVEVRVYLDNESIGTETIASIAAGGYEELSMPAQNLTAGTHWVTVMADPDNLIAESDESNNNAQGPISVEGAGGAGPGEDATAVYAAAAAIPVIFIIMLLLLLLARRKKKKEDERPAFASYPRY